MTISNRGSHAMRSNYNICFPDFYANLIPLHQLTHNKLVFFYSIGWRDGTSSTESRRECFAGGEHIIMFELTAMWGKKNWVCMFTLAWHCYYILDLIEPNWTYAFSNSLFKYDLLEEWMWINVTFSDHSLKELVLLFSSSVWLDMCMWAISTCRWSLYVVDHIDAGKLLVGI